MGSDAFSFASLSILRKKIFISVTILWLPSPFQATFKSVFLDMEIVCETFSVILRDE